MIPQQAKLDRDRLQQWDTEHLRQGKPSKDNAFDSVQSVEQITKLETTLK